MTTGLAELLKDLENQGVPGRTFWENDLEMAMGPVLQPALEDAFVAAWMQKRTGRQADMLGRFLGGGVDGSTRKRKAALKVHDRNALPYVLVEAFAKFKTKVAVFALAKGRLAADLLAACQKDEAGEDFDKVALLFALYKQDPENLALVFHLDKIHKAGFARMKLKGDHRKPAHSLRETFDDKALGKILAAFDAAQRDGQRTELKGIDSPEGRFMLFIRRPERPDHILDEGQVRHGYRPEWIILDFEEGAKRVNISSISVDVPLEIANRIASTYFGKPCEYENESKVTEGKQIEVLLKKLAAADQDGLRLVEIVVAGSPLSGAPKLKISDEDSKPIGPAIAHFEKAVGPLLSRIDRVESVKVLFKKKRVSLIPEPAEEEAGAYVVRYSDHRLNGYERVLFEGHMRKAHEIPVLSTEKRFKR